MFLILCNSIYFVKILKALLINLNHNKINVSTFIIWTLKTSVKLHCTQH